MMKYGFGVIKCTLVAKFHHYRSHSCTVLNVVISSEFSIKKDEATCFTIQYVHMREATKTSVQSDSREVIVKKKEKKKELMIRNKRLFCR